MSLRFKFGLFTSLVVIGTTAIIAGAIFVVQKRLLTRNLAIEQERQVQSFAAICRHAINQRNELLIVSYIKHLSKIPGNSYAYFVDSSSRIVAHTDTKFFYKPLKTWLGKKPGETAVLEREFELKRRTPFMGVISPGGMGVGEHVHTMGFARIGFDRSHMAETIRLALRETLQQIFFISLIGVAAGILAGVIAAWRMTRSPRPAL